MKTLRTVCPGLVLVSLAAAQGLPPLRPPATPLVAHDPYFSIWSFDNELTASPTRHWTGSEQPLTGLLRIDGAPYRFMGSGRGMRVMRQTARELTPTRTSYKFEQAGVELTLTFLTPALPDDLDVLSRPVTYVNFDLRSTDGREHRTVLYFDAASSLSVNTPDQGDLGGGISGTGSRGQTERGRGRNAVNLPSGPGFVPALSHPPKSRI